MNFKPILDNLLVRRNEAENKTASGFIIPDSSVQKPSTGTVLAMGPGKANKAGVVVPIAEIKVDDVIMFNQGAGIPVKVEGEDYLILKEEEIFAIVG